jgi:hypothetical protein
MKKSTFSLFVLSIILLLTPLVVYFINFRKFPISNRTETWGQFGDYLNGTFMPVIALAGVVVTLILGIISDKRNATNIIIEQQKLRPILHIGYIDSEEMIKIFMVNKGSGPLIITKFRLLHLQNSTKLSSIFDCLPIIKTHFDNYTGNQNNTVLSPNEETVLLLFKILESDDQAECEEDRDLTRQYISNYKIVVDYKDVYDKNMPTYERSLEWFGRHFG